jgi:hypothetical protein
MADQTSGDAAPPAFETKNLSHGVAPAPVPYVDSTHIDRGETGAVEEPAVTPASDDKSKTSATRKTAGAKDS